MYLYLYLTTRLIALTLALSIYFPSHAGQCPADELLLLRKTVESEAFEADRGLSDHHAEFGAKYMYALASLTPNDVWLDGGAGAARAQIEYLAGALGEMYPTKARCVAVSVTRHSSLDPRYLKAIDSPALKLMNSKQLTYLHGRYIEQIPKAELGHAKLITDFFGALSYTENLSDVLQLYFSILDNNGTIFAAFTDQRTRIIVGDSKPMMLSEWLKTIPGIVLEPIKVGSNPSFVIKKTALYRGVPKTVLTKVGGGRPPTRVFRVE